MKKVQLNEFKMFDSVNIVRTLIGRNRDVNIFEKMEKQIIKESKVSEE